MQSRVARFFLVQHTKTGKNIPNDHKSHKIYNNDHKMNQHLPLQDRQKFTQIGIFGFENIPSGTPEATTSYNEHLF
jgi:hypothetical protein